MKQSAVSHTRQPFGVPVNVRSVPPGTLIADTMPEGPGRFVCRLNGGPGFLSREAWGRRVGADVVEWLEYPAGSEEDAGILQLVLGFVVLAYTGNPTMFLVALAGQVVDIFNDVAIPVEQQRNATSPTYSTSIQGNQARLYQAVPKICGRHQTYPPFAAQPYSEFDADSEQYLYVLLAIGVGNHEIERVLIDDTDINHFADVLTSTYLPPGVAPSVVLANVINSPEVSSQDMLTGEYIGGFAACGPRKLARSIGIDVVAPEGIGVMDAAGDVGNLDVEWQVEIRSLNEFGTPLTPWSVLAYETRTAASREPQRWSVRYQFDSDSTAIRPEIRLVRTDVKSTNARHLNDLVWSAMRAYLDGDAPLNPAVAHFEVVMRASKQLSQISQNRISVIATGMCRELLDDLTFGAEIASRNPADWLADLWTSTTWGEGLEESQVDLATLYTLKTLWAARQDRFDYVFDSTIDADTACQIIAGAGRARCFRRGGVRTLVRDQLATLPRTAFMSRNTVPGSMIINEELPQQDLPDGVIVEYFDNRSWNFGLPIECPAPGIVSMQRPLRVRLTGVTGRIQATRDGLYEAARLVLRRQTVQCVTEMQGTLPAFGTAVRWQSEVTRWQSGDVVSWDEDTGEMQLSEPPDWANGAVHLVLIRDDGTPTDPIEVEPGSTSNRVIIPDALDFTPSTEDGTRDRTQYMLGRLAEDELIAKVAAIEDGGMEDGAQLYKISGFIDDERIHAADNAYLPSPGEIQDPIDTTEGEPGGGTTPVVNLTNLTFGDSTGSYGEPVQFYLNNDGSFTTTYAPAVQPNEWLFISPVDISVTELFEVRATILAGQLNYGVSSAVDTWLSLDTTRTWGDIGINYGGEADVTLLIEIRDVATETLQESAVIHILNSGGFSTGGGG